MATRVELPKAGVQHALEIALHSYKRAAKSASNVGVKQLLEKDVADMTIAINTLSEIK